MPPNPNPPPVEDNATVQLIVEGRVQGVGYRFFAHQEAQRFGLRGWVRNLPNGFVEAQAQGSRAALEQWITILRHGPPLSRVDHIRINWVESSALFDAFEIRV